MTKRFAILAALLMALAAPLSAQNWTTVTASNIQDVSGTKLASGSLCFQGTDALSNPVSFQAGGGGQVIRRPVCAAIANGAIGSFQVPNPANTIPAGIFYTVTVSQGSQNALTYRLVQFTGASFSFDTYAPVGINAQPPSGSGVAGPFTVNGNLSVTGSLTLGSFTVTGNLIEDASIIIGGTGTKQTSGGPELISFQNSAANHVVFGGWVTGEANARHLDSINGFMEWGAGGSSDQDIAFFRNWPGGLAIQSFNGTKSDHTFSVHAATSNGSVGASYFRVDQSGSFPVVDVENGARLAVNGAVGGAPVDVIGQAGGNGVRVQAASGDVAYSSFVSGDSYARFAVLGSGAITLGGGPAAGDTTLNRPAAGQLNVTGAVGLMTATPTDAYGRIFLDNANVRLLLGPGNAPADTPIARAGPGEIALTPVTFANLGTPVNGTICFCSDCTVANPCAGGGTGAYAKRLNGAWVCN